MNRQNATVFACAILAGCAAGRTAPAPTPVNLPDGAKGYALHCVGRPGDSSKCVAQAVQLCAGLYSIVDPEHPSDPTASVPDDKGMDRTLVVKCLPP